MSPCASAPTATARLGERNRQRGREPCRCHRWWSPHCANCDCLLMVAAYESHAPGLGRVLINCDCSTVAECRRQCVRVGPHAQAIFFRRRHQPRRPQLAKIRPGRPAPAIGPGTGLVVLKALVPDSAFEVPAPTESIWSICTKSELASFAVVMIDLGHPVRAGRRRRGKYACPTA